MCNNHDFQFDYIKIIKKVKEMCVLCSITLNSCWNPSISLVKKKKKKTINGSQTGNAQDDELEIQKSSLNEMLKLHNPRLAFG